MQLKGLARSSTDIRRYGIALALAPQGILILLLWRFGVGILPSLFVMVSAALLCLVLFIKPQLGVYALALVVSTQLQIRIPGSTFGFVAISQLLALAMVSVWSQKQILRRLPFPRAPYFTIAVAFITVRVVSLLINGPRDTSLAGIVWTLVIEVAVICLYLLVVTTVVSRRHLERVLYLFFFGVTMVALLGFVEVALIGQTIFAGDALLPVFVSTTQFGGRGLSEALRATSTFVDPNTFGAYLSTTLMMSLAAYSLATERRIKHLLLLSILVQFAALLLTFSRAAWLAMPFGIVIYGMVHRRVRGRLAVLSLALVFLVTVEQAVPTIGEPAPLVPYSGLSGEVLGRSATLMEGLDNLEFTGRVAKWQAAIETTLGSPLLGNGNGLVASAEATARYGVEYLSAPHNMFLFVAVRDGIINATLLGILLLLLLRDSLNLYQTTSDPLLKGVGLGVFVGIITGYGFAAMFSEFVYYVPPWMLLWCALGIVASARRLDQQRALNSIERISTKP